MAAEVCTITSLVAVYDVVSTETAAARRIKARAVWKATELPVVMPQILASAPRQIEAVALLRIFNHAVSTHTRHPAARGVQSTILQAGKRAHSQAKGFTGMSPEILAVAEFGALLDAISAYGRLLEDPGGAATAGQMGGQNGDGSQDVEQSNQGDRSL